ncbi:hypothetical protein, partial [Thalassoglobus neptunius]|uniref:hypothetical protein n=1 Tax=Thalassoglobus neptunius TaxID=1938619 RepID=UPI001E4276E2
QRRNNLYRHSRPRRSHPSTGFLINNSAPFFARRALRFLTDVYKWQENKPLGVALIHSVSISAEDEPIR